MAVASLAPRHVTMNSLWAKVLLFTVVLLVTVHADNAAYQRASHQTDGGARNRLSYLERRLEEEDGKHKVSVADISQDIKASLHKILPSHHADSEEEGFVEDEAEEEDEDSKVDKGRQEKKEKHGERAAVKRKQRRKAASRIEKKSLSKRSSRSRKQRHEKKGSFRDDETKRKHEERSSKHKKEEGKHREEEKEGSKMNEGELEREVESKQGVEIGESEEGEEAESEEDKEGGEEEEEEYEFTIVDINGACMLIGGVSFMMVLLTIVNYEDDDIRRYAWDLISTVCSIFVSVMIFGCINTWILESLGHQAEEKFVCGVQYLHLFAWFMALQLTLAVSSGSIGEGPNHGLELEQWVIADAMRADYGTPVKNGSGEYDESVVRNLKGTRSVMVLSNGIEVPVEKKKSKLEQRHRRMKCWGTLLAHMTGFAAINAGGTMQHLSIFAQHPLLSLVPMLINQLFITLLFIICNFARGIVKSQAAAAGRKGIRAAMFDEEVTDAENDISCLAGSFLLIQSVRFFQVGELPTMVGELESTPWPCIYSLYGVGAILLVITVILIVIKSRTEFEESSCPYRFIQIMTGMASMGFAWCCLFGSRTVFLKTPQLDANDIGMVTIAGRVLLALILSLISTAAIFVLDCISDAAKRGAPPGKNPGGEIVSQLVFAKSILVGFSWEHSFDGGVEAIASMTANPLLTQSALAGFMWFVVVPAWRKHILRKSLMLQDYYAKQNQADIQILKTAQLHIYSSLPLEQDDSMAPECTGAKEEKPASARELYRQTLEIKS